MWKKILIIVFIILFVSLVVYIVIYDYRNESNLKDARVNNEIIIDEKDFGKNQCRGAITGSLSYPSEIIPNGSIVCAKNIGTNNLYCTLNQTIDSKFLGSKGYKLEVPQGIYSVSALFPFVEAKYLKEYKYAGENCLKNNCKDENISVSVGCDVVSGVNLFKEGTLSVFKEFYKL